MHPVARIFQILFLIAGTVFVAAALILYYDDFQQSTVARGSWTCEVVDDEQRCTIKNLSLNPGNRDEAFVNLAAGATLMIAAAAVAAGGRPRSPERPILQQTGGPMPPYGPAPGPYAPGPGGPGPGGPGPGGPGPGGRQDF